MHDKPTYQGFYERPKAQSDQKPRTCLHCLKTFISDSPANRICPRCKFDVRDRYETPPLFELCPNTPRGVANAMDKAPRGGGDFVKTRRVNKRFTKPTKRKKK